MLLGALRLVSPLAMNWNVSSVPNQLDELSRVEAPVVSADIQSLPPESSVTWCPDAPSDNVSFLISRPRVAPDSLARSSRFFSPRAARKDPSELAEKQPCLLFRGSKPSIYNAFPAFRSASLYSLANFDLDREEHAGSEGHTVDKLSCSRFVLFETPRHLVGHSVRVAAKGRIVVVRRR